jgi:hypothetical protein
VVVAQLVRLRGRKTPTSRAARAAIAELLLFVVIEREL